MSDLKRPRYFTGQLLSAVDLQAEQDYHRESRRRHLRLLHGAGVIHGLTVTVERDGGRAQLVVQPGAALDAAGNLLELAAVSKLPITTRARAWQVVLRYHEIPCDPVPGLDATSGADFSRTLETTGLALVPEPAGREVKSPGPHHFSPGLGLARFVRTTTAPGWRRDARFRVAHVHVA